MKILHVIASITPRYGGPSLMVLELCRELAKQGHDVAIFTTNIDGDQNLDVPLNQSVQSDGFSITYFPVQLSRYYKFSLPMAKALREQLSNFDVVHIHSLYLFQTLITAYYCIQYKIPYTIRPHGTLDPFIQKRHALRKKIYNFLIEKQNLDRAAAIHFTTEEEKELAAPLKIKAPGVVIPNGLCFSEYQNLPEYGSFKKKYPLLEHKKIILFLSRINFKKGLDILVKALQEIADTRQDVYLVIAGPDNEGYGKKVSAWLKQAGILNRAIFTGMLLAEEKLAAFRDSDLFVLPSYSENFGIAVIEAMACGLPVIISNKVNIWREVEQAGAGIVTDCDSKQVAEAIIRLLNDTQLAKVMGQNGRSLVQHKYSWSQAAKQLIKVDEDIISEHSRLNA